MKKVCYVVLVRHGESVYNRKGITGGDPPLTSEGRLQAKRIKELLKDFKFDEVYSSNLLRAIETAEIIAGTKLNGRNIIPGLRERHFGSLEEKPSTLYEKGHEKRMSISNEENWLYKHVPDMESDQELYDRFLKNFKAIAKQNLGKTILIVAHGGIMRTTLMKLERKAYPDHPQGSFKNAGYIELEYSNGAINLVKVVNRKD